MDSSQKRMNINLTCVTSVFILTVDCVIRPSTKKKELRSVFLELRMFVLGMCFFTEFLFHMPITHF